MPISYPCALTIAGSDSSGGAGIQADLKSFAALGVYGASVLTALTAQNTRGVRAVHDVPPEFVCAQIDAVLTDLPIGAIKIGMLSVPATIHAVAQSLAAYPSIPLVLDPVMISKSGAPLLHDVAVDTLRHALLPRATLLTPNLPEAARLLERTHLADLLEAAQALLALGPQAVLLKGGHGDGDEVIDLLVTREQPSGYVFRHSRQLTRHTHGTGCTLSSAIAAGLAHGLALPLAVAEAIEWLQGAIANAWPLGGGHGPVHHFWQRWPVAACQEPTA